MTKPQAPTLQDQLTAPLVEDRDLVFAIPVERRVRQERRRTVLAALLWRAALAALVGLLAAAAVVGVIHIARLTMAAIFTA